VTPTQDAANLVEAVGNLYTFTETFSPDGYSAARAAFTRCFVADNSVDSITLNLTTLAASGGGFSDWTNFDPTGASFVAGANTLTFVVRNYGDGSSPRNPAGLLVELVGTADAVDAVPDASV
jgi:hypothetical protein